MRKEKSTNHKIQTIILTNLFQNFGNDYKLYWMCLG